MPLLVISIISFAAILATCARLLKRRTRELLHDELAAQL